jgi:hypothetical protein
MSRFSTLAVLPKDWESAVSFKVPKSGDKIGFIDTRPDPRTSFCLVSASDKPLKAGLVRTPFEATTLNDILTKNKLSLRFQMNKVVWESFADLDICFDNFLIANRKQLYGAAEAEYLEKNPGAISLKRSKRLAPTDSDGHPIYDAFATLRINGRVAEVENIEVKDGPTGRFVSSVVWAPRTEALAPGATRFSIVTDASNAAMPTIRETLPVVATKVGASRVRYVGPGDMSKNSVLRHALVRPAYWSASPGGGATITFVADYLVFENMADEGGAADNMPAHRFVPAGFHMADDESAAVAAPEAMALAKVAPAVQDELKRRRIVPEILPPFSSSSSSSRSMTGGGPPAAGGGGAFSPPRRAMTGGAGGGTVRRSAAIPGAISDPFEDQEEIWRELDGLKKDALAFMHPDDKAAADAAGSGSK